MNRIEELLERYRFEKSIIAERREFELSQLRDMTFMGFCLILLAVVLAWWLQ